MQNNFEIWKQVSGYENYYVSNFGRVKNVETEKLLKQSEDKNGYFRVSLSKDNKRTTFRIHRLVAIEFIDNRNNKKCVDHIDGDRKNNFIGNLRWATDKQNSANRKKIDKATSSIYKGVYFDKDKDKWRTRIEKDGDNIHIGYYENETEAARAYDKYAKELFGDYAKLNF
jgi:hypothetical protein